MKALIVFILGLMAVLLVYSAVFVVDFNEIAIVERFGQATPPVVGATNAGLHFKWPWPVEKLIRYDARIFVFEDTYEEIQTHDKQNVLVTVFCAWRIGDPLRFLRRIRTVEQAEQLLRAQVRSVKSDVVGKYPLGKFLNTDPNEMRVPEIEQEILQLVRGPARNLYGIDVVSIGIKSLGLPQDVTKEVIKSMTSERDRFAERYRSRGKSYAELIRHRAQNAADTIISFAKFKAQRIKTEGDRAAARFYPVYRQDEQLAIYLQRLEFLKQALRKNTVIMGSAEIDRSLGWLTEPPSMKDKRTSTSRPSARRKK